MNGICQSHYRLPLIYARRHFLVHSLDYGHRCTSTKFIPNITSQSVATEHGLRWAIHQDHPAFPGPPLPFANMKTAVIRTQRDDNQTVYGPQYRVSIDEALKAYTINAAWQLHKDDKLGSLTENKKADLVILSHNPYKVDPLQLEDIQVIDTFLDGRPINASDAYITYSVQRAEGTASYTRKNNCI